MVKSRFYKRSLSVFVAIAIAFSTLCTFPAIPVAAQSATQAEYYVSPDGDDSFPGTIGQPFRTIEKARDVVRSINDSMTGDIYVYLRGGDYRLTKTIDFGLEDSGTNGFRIYYQAYPGETPVLNGSTKVTGWTKAGLINGIDGIYEATLDRSTKLRYLFVNDKRAQMTKKAAKGQGGYGTYSVVKGQADWAWQSGSNSDGVKYNLADVPEITSNKDDLEIVNGSTWNENIVCTRDVITSSDGLSRVLQLQQPYGAMAQTPGWGAAFTTTSSHTIYNAIEFMKNPGEFYFDKTAKKLYYYPRAGENMDTANVEAPFVDKLIDLKGTSTVDRIKNITFKGITFANTDWNLMEVGGSYGRTTCQSADGYIAYYGNGNWHDTAYTLLDTYPGMINVKSAESIDFISNTIKHSGADGISMVNDVVNSNLIGNYIYDITASGITVGHPQHVYLDDSMDKSADAANNKNRQVYAAGVEGICTNVVINNNMLWDCSTAPGFGGCAGITSFFSDRLKITYNTVHTSGYNGITLGWGWCNFQNSTSCKDNDISYNRIYNALNRLHDSGAIYTIGQMPGTTINNNYVNGIPDKSAGPTYGLHNDEGTTFIQENNNVLDISPNVTYTINCEDFGQKHDLTIRDTYATTYKMGKNPPNSTIDVPVVVPDNVWPIAQYNVALNAGVQEEYRSILPSHLFEVQDYVFPASCSVTEGAISIRSSGDAANSVWFAPAGTTSFVEGAAMTKAAGTATSIAIPANAGTYKLFVVNSSNSVVGESKAILRVNASDGIEKAVQADDFKTNGVLGSQWSVKNEDNTNYSFVSEGLQIATQAGDVPDDSIKNMFLQSADGDWVAQTKVTLSAAESAANQQAGLVVYGDSKNFIKLTYERVGSNSVYGFYNTLDGTKTTVGNTANGNSGVATLNNQLVHYFRLVKSGTKYTAYYSTDDVTYNLIGSTASSIDPKLGLIACNGAGSTAASINAVFEYLKIGTPADIDKDASLSGITVDGTPLSGFDSSITNYNMYVPDTVTSVPVINATPVDSGANVSIQDAASLPGTTTITVSNGYNKKVYKVSFGSTMKYEAENATLSGGAVFNRDNAGYSGEGYVQGYIYSGTACTSFTVNVSKPGKYTLDLRYAAGFSNVTNIGLYVNGTKIKNPTFNSTGGWTKWANAVETITLNSGENTIEYKVNSAGTFDCINLDYITLTKVADEFAPTWPENSSIKITNLSETGLTIVWPVAVDNVAVTRYNIYNGINLLTTVAGNVNSYDISGLIAGTDYTIKIEAGDAFGNWSADGPSAAFTTLGGPDITAPTWPLNSAIKASNTVSNGLTITWPAAQDDRVLSNYRIYKGTDLLATVSPAAINSYDVGGLTAETEYTFRVEAGDLAGNWSTNGPVNVLKTNSAIKLEAENAALAGSAGINSKEHKGFSGTGYVDGNNQENASTTFKVNVPSAGTYTVSLRYATSNTNASTNMGLSVNGTKIKNLTCNKTANWDTWDNEIETVTLNSGENTIEYKTVAFSWDCINIDYIVIEKVADADTIAPTWPQASTVTASAIGVHSLTLKWTPAVDDTGVTSYEIYDNSGKLGTVAGNINSYEVMNLEAGTEYTFSVQAGDQAGNISADGPTVTLSTLPDNGQGDTQAPGWPDGSSITVSDITENGLTLSWPEASDNTAVTGYVVFKGEEQLPVVAGNVTSYNVSGLTAGTQYTFTVKATDASSNWSEPGLSVTETTKTGEPQDKNAPTWPQGSTLEATGISSSGLTLTWSAAQDDTAVTSYRIYKGSQLIGTVAEGTYRYNVAGLSSGTTYVFSIQAGDGSGNWSSDGPSTNATTAQSGSGSSGSGSSSNGSTSTPAETTTPGKIKVAAPVLDTASGIAKVDVSANALAKALKEAKVVSIDIPKATGAAAYAASIPTAVLSSGKADAAIKIATEFGTVVAPLNMLSAAELTGIEKVELSVEKADASKLDSAKKAAIGDKPVFEVNLLVNGKVKAWSNPSAALTVKIPYAPTAAELANSEYLTVWYLDSNGKAVQMRDAKYVPSEKAMVFTTTHLSKYAVVYTKKDFEDMLKYSWAEQAVKALAADGIIEGTSDTAFSPAQRITRAEYVAWLVRTLGLTADIQENFSDVEAATKYYQEIGVAKALGITVGFNGKFSPEREISRQELASLTINALKTAKVTLEKGNANDIRKYTDSKKIAAYAVENMASMVKMGFITGNSKTTLNPTGATTRAEAAAILYKIYTKE